MDNKLSSIGRAFLTGGLICLAIQVIISALGAVMPPEVPLSLRGAVALLLAGLITVFLTLSGAYAKIADFGGMGANLPFIGLVPALTEVMCEARAHGASLGGAVVAALKVMLVLFGSGFAFSLVFAFACTAFGVGIFA